MRQMSDTCVSVSDDGDDRKLMFTSLSPQHVSLCSQLVQLTAKFHLSFLNINQAVTNAALHNKHHHHYHHHVGCVAQWLERRSLTGELSLASAQSVADV